MLKVELTKNLAGFTISGTYDDLDRLQTALYDISDEDLLWIMDYHNIYDYPLSIAYDIRHAKQSDREVFLVDNGLYHDWYKDWPEKNVHFSENVSVVIIFTLLASLDELAYVHHKKYKKLLSISVNQLDKERSELDIEQRYYYDQLERLHDIFLAHHKDGTKSDFQKWKRTYVLELDGKLSESITLLRFFRMLVINAMRPVIKPKDYQDLIKRYQNQDYKDDVYVDYYMHYVNYLDANWFKKTPKQRKALMMNVFYEIASGNRSYEYHSLIEDIKKYCEEEDQDIWNVGYDYDVDFDTFEW